MNKELEKKLEEEIREYIDERYIHAGYQDDFTYPAQIVKHAKIADRIFLRNFKSDAMLDYVIERVYKLTIMKFEQSEIKSIMKGEVK